MTERGIDAAAVRRDRRPRAADAAAVALRARRRRAAARELADHRHGARRAGRRRLSQLRADEALEKYPPGGPPRRHGRALPQPAALPAARRRPSGGLRRAGQGDRRPVHGWRSSCRPRRACSKPTIDGLAARGPRRPDGAHRRSKSRSAPTSPRAARSTTRSPPPFPRSASSASTIISARRRCRTCSRCASPTCCSSRCGTRRTSTTCRSPSPRPSGSKAAADYYDEAGALRDMVQNHMLQLLALVAMEPPSDFDADRGARREGQGAARAAPDHRRRCRSESVTGQYARGAVDGAAGAGLRRGTRPRQRHRDVRRAQGARRQLALAGRAVLLAHRQAHARARDRDRHPVQATCRTRSSPRAARRRGPTGWSSASSPRRTSSCR